MTNKFLLNDSEHWHARAEEARLLAKEMKDSETKDALVRIADGYEHLVQWCQTFDPETARLVGIAFETARAAIKRRADLSDEMTARTIIELAKAGEHDVDFLCEPALNAPTGAVSPPNPPPLPAASPPEPPGSSS